MLTKLKSIFFPAFAQSIERLHKQISQEIITHNLELIRTQHHINLLTDQQDYLATTIINHNRK